jgi:hypothetical protein
MLKDIDSPKVEGVGLAIVYEKDKDGNLNWTSYLINEKDVALEGVLVRSSGYGKVKKKDLKTSDLRYFLDVVPARSYRKLEIIPEDLLPLNNQYWVSYYLEGKLYDKKFVFVPDSIHERHLVELPVIGQKGVLIS